MAVREKMWLEERDEMRLVVSKTVMKKWAVSGQHLKITVQRFQIGGKNKRLKQLDRSTVLSMLCIFLFFNELHALILPKNRCHSHTAVRSRTFRVAIAPISTVVETHRT